MSLKEILSATPAARVVLVVSTLAVTAFAVFATFSGLAEQRVETSRAEGARALAGIADVSGRQRQMLAASQRARTKPASITSLSRKGQRLLDDLRSHSRGGDAEIAADLSVSYRIAARHAASAVGGRATAGHATTARLAVAKLTAIQGKAEAALLQRQTIALQPSSSLLETTRTLATLVVGLLALMGCVAVLRSRPDARLGERDAKLELLEVQARTDNLTGLGNHRGFHHDLSLEVQRRAQTGSVFSLMAIDLDGLKQINDTQGHQAGDTYIKRVSDLARSVTGTEGTVYRTGGDEFMILLPGSRNWNALALANKLDRLTREALGRRALSIGLTESTGTEARHLLIHQADVALYEAKRTKLNALTYHPGLTASSEVAAKVAPSHHQRTLAAALARAVDAKDAGTRSHSETVAELAVAIGKALHIDGDGLERLRLAGLLHDVGKIGVSDSILQKPAALLHEEEDEMKEHVTIGHGIMLSAEMPTEAVWVLHHHERVDGAGYPQGLRTDQIPLESRIIAVADAFEAMTGTRPYRESFSVEEALVELRAHTDKQFDSRCVGALEDVLSEAPVGAALRTPVAAPWPASRPQPVAAPALAAAKS